ncbi:hypothetical protein ON010_g13673 [Phytophthora cinnamomi]|nr:hypothetical protein ON010_g13673 [Phytophthora cinnamomi]
MQRPDDLPVSVLLNVLGFLHQDVAAQLLSRKTQSAYRRSIRDIAAVSTSWASAIQAVERHFRDSILVFHFQPAPVIGNEAEGDRGTIPSDTTNNSTVAVDEMASGGIFQLVRGLLSAFACTSSAGPDRLSRRRSEEEESRELALLNREKVLMQHKVKHVESELRRLSNEVTAGRQPRRRVELWLNDPHDVTVHSVDDNCCGDTLRQHWKHIFSSCKYLVRLDVSGVSVESDHLPAILSAVGEYCVNLEELVMPQQVHLMHRRRSVHNVLEAFHAALAALDVSARAHQSNRGGLKKLVLPSLFPNENMDATAAAIGEHCPNLQCIEGLRLAAFSRRRRLTSVDMRNSALQSWDAFCRGCSHLTALNWCSLPCSDEVFDIFGSYPKLELRSLVLPGNCALWRRDYVLQERHHVEPLSPSNSFSAVLRACPNLTSLDVLLSDMQGDAEFLGDQFLQTIVDACPLLERLALVEASGQHGFGPSNRFTSEGFEVLEGLGNLQTIELNGVALSERTLLALAARSRSPDRPRTRIDVTLGVRGWNVVDVASCFHETITNLLKLLLSPEASEYAAFIMRLRVSFDPFCSILAANDSRFFGGCSLLAILSLNRWVTHVVCAASTMSSLDSGSVALYGASGSFAAWIGFKRLFPEPDRALRHRKSLPWLGGTWAAIKNADHHYDREAAMTEGMEGRPRLFKVVDRPGEFIIGRPEIIDDIIRTHAGDFGKGEYVHDVLSGLLGDGIVAMDGHKWIRQRKTARSLFSMRELRESVVTVIQENVLTLHDIFQRAVDTGESFDLLKLSTNSLSRWSQRSPFGETASWSSYACLVPQYPLFSASPRMRLGAKFAMLEMKITAASLLSKYHCPRQTVIYRLGLTLAMKNGLQVKVEKTATSC